MGTVTTNNPYGTTSQVVTTNSDGSKDVKTYAGVNGSGSLIEDESLTVAGAASIVSPIYTQILTLTWNLLDSNNQIIEQYSIGITYDPNQAPYILVAGPSLTWEHIFFLGYAYTSASGPSQYVAQTGTGPLPGNVEIYHSDHNGVQSSIIASTGDTIEISAHSLYWISAANFPLNSITTENFFSAFVTNFASIRAAETPNSVAGFSLLESLLQPGTVGLPAFASSQLVGATASARSARDPGADGLFDTTYYIDNDTEANYAAYYRLYDNGKDALADYMAIGWEAGDDPSANFSTAAYLSKYPDAAASGIDPLTYYENVGKAMGETVTTVAQWAAANAPPANTGSGGSTTTGGTVPVTPIVSTPTGSTSGGTSAGTSTPTTVPITPATIAVYRFFDKADGTHFFTASASERATIDATRPDMTDEGAGLNSVQPTDPNAVAVYRFFDTRFGTHFFTASSTERDNVIASRADLTYEGVGFYEHGAKQGGDVAVYRFFDTVHGTHFYSSSPSEVAQIAATRTDLTNEGVGFYAPGTAST